MRRVREQLLQGLPHRRVQPRGQPLPSARGQLAEYIGAAIRVELFEDRYRLLNRQQFDKLLGLVEMGLVEDGDGSFDWHRREHTRCRLGVYAIQCLGGVRCTELDKDFCAVERCIRKLGQRIGQHERVISWHASTLGSMKPRAKGTGRCSYVPNVAVSCTGLGADHARRRPNIRRRCDTPLAGGHSIQSKRVASLAHWGHSVARGLARVTAPALAMI